MNVKISGRQVFSTADSTVDGHGPGPSTTDIATLPAPAISPTTQQATARSWLFDSLTEDVDPDKASFPLVWYCFVTGLSDVTTFSMCSVWCAFQTGNLVHLGLATARLFGGPTYYTRFLVSDQQAFVSLSAFLCGASVGRVTTENALYFAPRRRAWLVGSTLLMAMLSLSAFLFSRASRGGGIAHSAINTFVSGTPSWTDTAGYAALGCMSASMGLQAVVAARLCSHFATSVVFTTALVEIASDPSLHKLNRPIFARDSRLLAIFGLLAGGVVGRALVDSFGAPSTLAVCAGTRVFVAISWFFVPAFHLQLH